MSKRILKVDALTLPDHYYLDAHDQCFYIGEYTAGAGHAFSETNQLILNLKKSVSTRGTAQWQYKERAIQQCASLLRAFVKPDAQLTFVPVPPSKSKADPLYDDRLVQILREACRDRVADARELVVQRESIDAVHLAAQRPTPAELAANYEIDESLVEPEPRTICVVDDVLTTGSHYKAVKQVLTARFPKVNVFGIFIARRVPKTDEI